MESVLYTVLGFIATSAIAAPVTLWYKDPKFMVEFADKWVPRGFLTAIGFLILTITVSFLQDEVFRRLESSKIDISIVKGAFKIGDTFAYIFIVSTVYTMFLPKCASESS